MGNKVKRYIDSDEFDTKVQELNNKIDKMCVVTVSDDGDGTVTLAANGMVTDNGEGKVTLTL